jgi:hypothetical protein
MAGLGVEIMKNFTDHRQKYKTDFLIQIFVPFEFFRVLEK